MAYTYQWSSLDYVAQGGFRIQLDVTWGAAEHWHMTSDFGDSQDGGGFLPARQSHFETRHEVREVRNYWAHESDEDPGPMTIDEARAQGEEMKKKTVS